MKIYLDDKRKTPKGYDIRTYTVEETIKAIQDHDGKIELLSLDNDLGTVKEGKEVMQWIEKQAYKNKIKPIEEIIFHTSNISAREEMRWASFNAYKYWKKHGYDI